MPKPITQSSTREYQTYPSVGDLKNMLMWIEDESRIEELSLKSQAGNHTLSMSVRTPKNSEPKSMDMAEFYGEKPTNS